MRHPTSSSVPSPATSVPYACDAGAAARRFRRLFDGQTVQIGVQRDAITDPEAPPFELVIDVDGHRFTYWWWGSESYLAADHDPYADFSRWLDDDAAAMAHHALDDLYSHTLIAHRLSGVAALDALAGELS